MVLLVIELIGIISFCENTRDFIPITANEFQNSKLNSMDEKIICPAEYAQSDFSKTCETNIFMLSQKQTIENPCDFKIIPNSNYITPIYSTKVYHIHIKKPITIRKICEQSTSTIHELKNSGFLSLKKDCRITTNDISVRSYNNVKFDLNRIIILNTTRTQEQLNLFKNYPIINFDSNNTILIQNLAYDFEKMTDKIDKIIQESTFERKLNEIRVKNNYITVTSYALIAFFIIALIPYIHLYSKLCKITHNRAYSSSAPSILMHQIHSQVGIENENDISYNTV